MPPKRAGGRARSKAKASPKLRGKAQAKGKAKSKSKAAPQASKKRQLSEEEEERQQGSGKSKDKRQRLNRRDSDEATDRAVLHRLGHLPSKVWEGLRNKKGQSIRDVAKIQVRKNKADGGRLPTKFWCQIFEDFKLNDCLSEALEVPEEDVMDENFVEALGVLHHDNLANRRSLDLERYLDYCSPLNRFCLYLLLRGVMESPTLAKSTAMRCQVSVLRYMRRTRAHEAHEDYWGVMKPVFDVALQWHWEDLSSKGVAQESYVVSHGKLLGMFVDMNDVKAILEAEEHESKPAEVKRVVEASATARSMFKSAWLDASRALFRETIEERLTELEHLDYDETEMESFENIMVQAAAQLKAIGHKIYGMTAGKVTFCGEECSVTFESTNDEWEWRRDSRIKTLALDAGLLEPYPWEKLTLALGSLPDVPEFVKLPKEKLAVFRNARKAAFKFLKEKKAVTIHQQMSVMSSKADALKALDRGVEVELSFLNERVEPLIKEKVQAQMLDCFPGVGKQSTMKRTMKLLNDLKLSELVQVAPPDVQGEVDGVISLLKDLSMSIAPKAKQIEAFSDFYKTVLHRAEHFYTVQVPAITNGEGDSQLITLRGREALLAEFKRISDSTRKKEKVLEVEELRALKTFGWVLGEKEQTQLQKWLLAATSHEMERSSFLSSTAKEKKASAVEKEELVAVGSLTAASCAYNGSSSSSSSSSSSNAHAASSPADKSQAKKNQLKANVLKLWKGKA